MALEQGRCSRHFLPIIIDDVPAKRPSLCKAVYFCVFARGNLFTSSAVMLT